MTTKEDNFVQLFMFTSGISVSCRL